MIDAIIFIGKALGVALVGLLLTAGILANISGTPDFETTSKNTLAKAYMSKNKDRYVTCYNSVNNGATVIGRVSMSYLTYETAGTSFVDKLNATEDKFKSQVETECKPTIDGYESNFKTFTITSNEIAKAQQSVLDKLLGGKPEADPAELREFEPSVIRFHGGNPFTNLIFSEEDVKQFFVAELGY